MAAWVCCDAGMEMWQMAGMWQRGWLLEVWCSRPGIGAAGASAVTGRAGALTYCEVEAGLSQVG
jgi:hypothetical protein